MNIDETTDPILVLIGGGRGNWPNIWTLLTYRPAKVYFLPPAGDTVNTRYFQEYVDNHGVSCTVLKPISAFDLGSVQRCCERIAQRHAGQPIVINITQAPKLMAIGACKAAWESGRRDIIPVHRNTVADECYAAFGNLPEPTHHVHPTLDDYLAAFGRRGVEKIDVTRSGISLDKFRTMAALMANPEVSFFHLALQLRNTSNQQCKNYGETITIKSDRVKIRRWETLFRVFEENGVIRGWTQFTDRAEFALTSEYAWHFLCGTWIEIFAHEQASAAYGDAGQKLFCDCRMSLMIPNHDVENEIDLACLTPSGLLLYASCKTNKDPYTEKNLDEITARADILGKDYCAKMLISNAPQTKANANFRKKAEHKQIVVVYGEDLHNLSMHMRTTVNSMKVRAR